MFTADQFRAKAAEYGALLQKTAIPNEIRDFQKLEKSFSSLAQNEDWLADNFDKIIHAQDAKPRADAADSPPDEKSAAAVEEHVLRCLGAAVIIQWNTIPTKLQRELFDTAASMGELLRTAELRRQIACFLQDHNDEERATDDASASGQKRIIA
jgi:rubrerythrin